MDFSHGVAVAGHSMGGQSAALAATDACAAAFNITSAALHHPASGVLKQQHGGGGGGGGGGGDATRHIGSNITSIPLAAFTSSGDDGCNASEARAYITAVGDDVRPATL